MKHIIASVLTLLFLSVAQADYQYELGIGQVDTDQETRIDSQITFSGGAPFPGGPVGGSVFFNSVNAVETQDVRFNGKYYFNPISTVAIPKQEAGFLSQQSQLYFGLRQTDNDTIVRLNDSNGTQVRDGASSDNEEFHLGIEWIGDNIPWILGLEHQTVDSESRAPSGFPDLKSEEKRWQYTLGYYLSDSSRLNVSYSDIERTSDQPVATFIGGPPVGLILGPANLPRNTFKSDQVRANYKHLFPAFKSQFIVLSLNFSRFSSDRSPDSDAYSIGLDFYPITELSLGVSYGESNPEFGSKSSAQALRAKYFVTDDVAVSFAAQSTDNSDRTSFNDGFSSGTSSLRLERNSLSLGVEMRF